MKLPVKIEPDRIRDSIVQVFYDSDIPFEVLIGYFYSVLTENEEYYYSNAPFPNLSRKNEPTPKNPNEIILNLPGNCIFYNDKVKIQLLPNSITFNCINGYLGWSKYSAIIEKALLNIQNIGIISSYTRAGIRYISEFPGIDLLDKVNVSYHLPFMTNPLQNSSARFEWKVDDDSIVLNLSNKLPVSPITKADDSIVHSELSVIDIDVIRKGLVITELPTILSVIDALHVKQKTAFFSLLRDDFLTSLNPQYS